MRDRIHPQNDPKPRIADLNFGATVQFYDIKTVGTVHFWKYFDKTKLYSDPSLNSSFHKLNFGNFGDQIFMKVEILVPLKMGKIENFILSKLAKIRIWTFFGAKRSPKCIFLALEFVQNQNFDNFSKGMFRLEGL